MGCVNFSKEKKVDLMNTKYGAIEFGGTKIIYAIGNVAGELSSREVISTATVGETF